MRTDIEKILAKCKSKDALNNFRDQVCYVNPMIAEDTIASHEQTMNSCSKAVSFIRETLFHFESPHSDWPIGMKDGLYWILLSVERALDFERLVSEREREIERGEG